MMAMTPLSRVGQPSDILTKARKEIQMNSSNNLLVFGVTAPGILAVVTSGSSKMSVNAEHYFKAKLAGGLVGWGALLWLAFCVGPYLYAVNDLIQWR
jgi:hypothetical protein